MGWRPATRKPKLRPRTKPVSLDAALVQCKSALEAMDAGKCHFLGGPSSLKAGGAQLKGHRPPF